MTPDYTVYIVDDERSIRSGLERELGAAYQTRSFATGAAAIAAVSKAAPDLVLLDIGLPDLSGLEVLRSIKQLSPGLLVIMITAYEDIDTVISAMRLGAYDYIVKPLHMDGLEVSIANALETIRLRKEVQQLQARCLSDSMPCFIGESDSIQGVMDLIGKVARSPDTPILVTGDTGTGKELIAGAIHYRSPNFKGPFVSVNCAAIPRELIESELFGYARGAFSGAAAGGKKGLIEAADGGTLFLDEVGDLGLEAQAKLLRFLQAGEFYRLGSTCLKKVAVRIVSATNRDLESMIGAGTFRKDLFFRLGVIRIRVPSLTERPEDILPLARRFLLEFAEKFSKRFSGFSAESEQALLAHDWAGNIRELRNMVERGALLAQQDMLTPLDLGLAEQAAHTGPRSRTGQSFPAPLTADGIDLEQLHADLDRHYIAQALQLTAGNESRAARLLGLNRHTFRYRRKHSP